MLFLSLPLYRALAPPRTGSKRRATFFAFKRSEIQLMGKKIADEVKAAVKWYKLPYSPFRLPHFYVRNFLPLFDALK